MEYELAIIGGGPAGIAAGIYAARKKIKTVFLTDIFGGQSVVSPSIENWVGTVSIPGQELADNMKKHLEAYKGDSIDIREGQKISRVTKDGDSFSVETEGGEKFSAKTVLITSGSVRKKLSVPGADLYDQKGLTYCASCDGPMYTDKDVAVIGGGNAGFESASQLVAYCKSVTLIHHRADFKADPVTVEKLLKNPKFHAVRNAEILEVKGEKFVTGLSYKDKDSGETKELPVEGIFVEIGFMPSTSFVKDLIKTDQFGAIAVDPTNQRASVEGIWAAGDCTDRLYHQNNISVGDAVRATEDIYVYLQLKK